jgi:hypothetical protein
MTENVLPDSGFSARTPNVQLFKYEHLYYTTKEAVLQGLKRPGTLRVPSEGLISQG